MSALDRFSELLEARERLKKSTPKINVSKPILPMQPEGEVKPSGPKPVKQSEVSASIKKKAADTSREAAIKKGYVSPEGRVQEKGVVTNRIRAGALGYGDPGKDPSRYGIKPQDVAAEKGTLFKRAVAGAKAEKRAARREIKTAIKSIEKRYPGATERTGTSFRGFSKSVSSTPPSKKDAQTLQRMARPQTSSSSAQALSRQLGGTGAGRRAQAASDAAKDIQSFEKQRAFHGRVMQAIKDLPPETPPKTTVTPKKPEVKTATSVKPPVKPLPKLNLDKYQVKTFDPKSFKPVAAKATAATAPSVTKAVGSSADDIAKAVSSVLSKERVAKAAEKAAATAKGWKTATRLAAPLAATFDAKAGYEAAKKTGASETRAMGAGAAKALGGLVGGALGAGVGSVAGPAGTFAGGTAGYTAGSEFGTRAYKAVTGDYGKKLTTQGVLTNIRKAVPQELRAQVPAGARKAFTDFVKQTGRAYGNWKRSQQQNEEYLQELDVKGALQSASRSPLVRNPLTRTLWRAIGPAARVAGAVKAASPSTSGPIGRAYGAAVAGTPPVISNVLQWADPTEDPRVKKVDKEVQRQHTKAYQANPTGYARMAAGSF